MLGTTFFFNSFHNHQHGVVIGATSLSFGYITVSTFIMYQIAIWEAWTWQNCQCIGVRHVSDMDTYPTQTQTCQARSQEEKIIF